MKLRALLIGMVMSIAAVGLMVFYMNRYEQEASGGAKIEVLVAVKALERGKPITDDQLGTREIPQAYLDARVIRARDRQKVLGLPAAQNLGVSQALAWTDLIAANDEQRDLSSLVQPGNRAMPIRLENSETIGLIRPGDSVDVLGVLNESKQAVVLLQRVLVLATGLNFSFGAASETRASSVLTLSESLQESQLLAIALEKSKVTVVLRSPTDTGVTEGAPDLSATVLSDSSKKSTAVAGRIKTGPIKLTAERAP
ncbi:MAG: hypothetical protein NVSMB1_06500 [Polyangiales bacterium]